MSRQSLVFLNKNLLKNFEENIFTQISITLFDNGLDVIFVGKRELNSSQNLKLLEFAKTHILNISYRFKNHAIPIFLNRKNIISLLMSIELMLLSVNINFVAFSVYLQDLVGQIFAIFVLTVAGAEAAIGLAILVVYFHNRQTIEIEDASSLKG